MDTSINVVDTMEKIKKEAENYQPLLISTKHNTKLLKTVLKYLRYFLFTSNNPNYEYSISDFISYNDEEFVSNSYNLILNRKPDPAGIESNLHLLSYKKIPLRALKIIILVRLAASSEAKFRKVKIKYLLLHFLISFALSIPFLGKFLSILSATFRLPYNLKQIQNFQLQTDNNVQSILIQIDNLNTQFTNKTRYLEKTINGLEKKIKRIQKSNQILSRYYHDIQTNHYFDIYPILNHLLQQTYHLRKKPIKHKYKFLDFYSQFYEDKWIFENLDIPKKGYFVDVGAADGISASNSYFFEKNGWNGLCIEPDPRAVKEAIKIRKNVINFAISSTPEKCNFYLAATITQWSSLIKHQNEKYKTIIIQTETLETILNNNNVKNIDLLTIDTEGTELDVWKSFDYVKYKPKILIIEFNTQDIANDKIFDYFSHLPYTLVHRTYANYIFIYNPSF